MTNKSSYSELEDTCNVLEKQKEQVKKAFKKKTRHLGDIVKKKQHKSSYPKELLQAG